MCVCPVKAQVCKWLILLDNKSFVKKFPRFLVYRKGGVWLQKIFSAVVRFFGLDFLSSKGWKPLILAGLRGVVVKR